MKNSVFTLIIAHVKNMFWTALWSPLALIVGLALFTPELDGNFGGILLACWLVQLFVTFFVHGIFLLSSYFWMQYGFDQAGTAYQRVYPILLIPIAVYLILAALILENIITDSNSIPLILTAMFCFITIYSFSLYTLLQNTIEATPSED